MRLFYQTLGMSRGSKSGHYGALLTSVITAAAAPGTTVDIFGLAPHRAVADQYRYLEFLDTSEVIENGLRAQAEGYDGFLIGNFFQPGLHELRELLTIPVLGLAEASVSMACLMGPTFSLINVNPKFNRRIVEGITHPVLIRLQFYGIKNAAKTGVNILRKLQPKGVFSDGFENSIRACPPPCEGARWIQLFSIHGKNFYPDQIIILEGGQRPPAVGIRCVAFFSLHMAIRSKSHTSFWVFSISSAGRETKSLRFVSHWASGYRYG